MENQIIVFVASDDGVNKYINILSYAVNYLKIERVCFVKITNSETLSDFDIANFVRKNLNDELHSLAKLFPEFYSKPYDVFSNHRCDIAWDYLSFKKTIREEVKNEFTFFDVTSLPKGVCLDVFVKLLSCDMENIINFEFTNKSAHKKLFHELDKSDYRVKKLIDEDSFMYTIKKFAREQNRSKLVILLLSIITSLILIQHFVPRDNPLNVILSFFTFLGGVLPISELCYISNITKIPSILKKRMNEAR
jgi:hypothetical protein